MKGISVWMWVIAGIIIGMVMFTLFVQIMSYLSIGRDKENAKAAIGEFAAVANSFCDAHIGEKATASFPFPNFVNKIFVSKDAQTYEESSDNTGKWLCIKIEKEVSCEKINCQLEMYSIEQKTNFSSMMDRLFGSSYQKYVFEISKTEHGVSAARLGMK